MSFAGSILRLSTLCALSATAACGRKDATPVAAPGPDLLVTVRNGAVAAADSVAAGWLRLRVEEDGNGHILVVFRLPDSAAFGDVAAFLAALDTAGATPAPALALGGPEIGDTGEVVIQLNKGRYLLGCVTRGPDRHRHASTGEAKMIRVTEGTSPAPHSTLNVPMVDFAYIVPERWAAGAHLLRVDPPSPPGCTPMSLTTTWCRSPVSPGWGPARWPICQSSSPAVRTCCIV